MRHEYIYLTILCLILTANSAWAQAESDVGPLTIAEIEVRGQGLSSELESTTSTILTNKQITNRVYSTPLDMLTLSPGISINNYAEQGLASWFSLRGYGGSHSNGVAIFLDGVPLNETDGYADTNVIIPLEIEKVEVIKGPSSVLYGNYASGGTVSYYTIKSGDFTRFRFNLGSFKTTDNSGVIARSSEKLDQVYAFQIYHTDGYRKNSEWNKQNVAGRWTYHMTDKFTGTLGLRAFNSEWDSAGYVPSYMGPKEFVDDGSGEGNGGKNKKFEARIDLNYQINDDSKMMFYAWGNDQDYTRYYLGFLNVPPVADPVNGYRIGGDERYNQRHVWGTGTSYNYDGTINGRKLIFVTGVDYTRESENRERWNLLWGDRSKKRLSIQGL